MLSISPGLWIISTPLGNPADLSPRAKETIACADIVLAEDTRRASWLFNSLGLRVKELVSFHEHNENKLLPQIVKKLEAKKIIALISDAGTPILADPGFRLVQCCHKLNIPVHPVPGPSAPIAALSVSGLPPIPCTFLGFLPRDHSGQIKLFLAFQHSPGSLIFFERKDRLKNSLQAALEILGNRQIAICRELTKEHEEIIKGNLADINQKYDALLGELTIVIGPPEQPFKLEKEKVELLLESELRNGQKLRQAAASILQECPGWSSPELYALAASLRNNPKDFPREDSD